MIHSSSSEDESSVEVTKDIPASTVIDRKNSVRSNNKTDSSPSIPESSHSSIRVPSPSISSTSEDLELKNRLHEEEEEHRQRLQLYVFVVRCIAYPFTARQPTDLPKRCFKFSKDHLQKCKDLISKHMNMSQEKLFNSILSIFLKDFLNSGRLERLVVGGGCSYGDLKDKFKDYLSKNSKISTQKKIFYEYLGKFESILQEIEDEVERYRKKNSTPYQMVSNKEEMYNLFQAALGIKLFEHQLVYNACQLDNADEQASAIRRELNERMNKANRIESEQRIPKLRYHALQTEQTTNSQYIAELRRQVTVLMGALERMPVTNKVGNGKTFGARQKFRKLQKRSTSSIDRSTEEEVMLSKSDVHMHFAIDVVVVEIQGLQSIAPNKSVYCTMEVTGCNDKLQTEPVIATKPVWGTKGDFTTTHPLPVVKVKLCLKNNAVLPIEDKELGKVHVQCFPNTNKPAQFYQMIVPKTSTDKLRVKLSVMVERPLTMKQCGYLRAQGKLVWKKWKRRYFLLVQVSQYNFAMCSYMEKKTEAVELVTIDGYTVDYITPMDGKEGAVFFAAVKAGDTINFSSDDLQEGSQWVQAIYRATSQSVKPTPVTQDKIARSKQLDTSNAHSDRLKKTDIDTMVTVDPTIYDHANLFDLLQRLVLTHRLNDHTRSLGHFSPAQVLVLDEYCSRYGVRDCHRHLCLIASVLDQAEQGFVMDMRVITYSFAVCSRLCSNKQVVSSKNPITWSTVSVDEYERFDATKLRLMSFLKRQLIQFQTYFPYGLPKYCPKSTLDLLYLLVKTEEESAVELHFRNLVHKCLNDGTVVTYKRLLEQFQLNEEGNMSIEAHVSSFTAFCKETVQLLEIMSKMRFTLFLDPQDEEFVKWFCFEIKQQIEYFLLLLISDLEKVLSQWPIDCWKCFDIYLVLNQYLKDEEIFSDGKHRLRFATLFTCRLEAYQKSSRESIETDLELKCSLEDWKSLKSLPSTCEASVELIDRFNVFITFLRRLDWMDMSYICSYEKEWKSDNIRVLEILIERIFQSFTFFINYYRASLDYCVPEPIFLLINTIIKLRDRTSHLCDIADNHAAVKYSFYSQQKNAIDKCFEALFKALMNKLKQVMDIVLSKLSRYDEGKFSASILKIAKPSLELAKDYIKFVRRNQEVICDRINDEFLVRDIFQKWYNLGLQQMNEWLTSRNKVQLNIYQMKILIFLFTKFFQDFQLQGVVDIRTNMFDGIQNRLMVEEAALSLNNPEVDLGVSIKDVDPVKLKDEGSTYPAKLEDDKTSTSSFI